MSVERSRIERAVELLVQEIVERVEMRQREASPGGEIQGEAAVAEAPIAEKERDEGAGTEYAECVAAEGGEPGAFDEDAVPAAPLTPSHAAPMLRRMALWLLLAVVLINVPLNRFGMTLATAMPDSASLVIRDGLVIKEEDGPEIYVYRDGQFRWISSLDAFAHYGFTWEDVHIVPDGYLERHEIGAPLHVLLKCDASPHIYRLEDGVKRWIRDIDTFVAEGHVWDDVRFVSCDHLRDLPDGETIPPDAGAPPQP